MNVEVVLGTNSELSFCIAGPGAIHSPKQIPVHSEWLRVPVATWQESLRPQTGVGARGSALSTAVALLRVLFRCSSLLYGLRGDFLFGKVALTRAAERAWRAPGGQAVALLILCSWERCDLEEMISPSEVWNKKGVFVVFLRPVCLGNGVHAAEVSV